MNAPTPAFLPALGQRLLAAIPATATPSLLALAGTLALAPQRRGRWRAPIAGLDAAELECLVSTLFPAAVSTLPLLQALRAEGEAVAGDPHDEFDDLIALLLEHQALPGRESRWLAHAVATASMADNHLWQDLGLPSRAVLGTLMYERFTALKLKNHGDMKWKKFFYRQLCERAGVPICKAPNCAVCSDRPLCFGPEE